MPVDIENGASRDVSAAMMRGVRMTCPACGKGSMFRAFLKVADHCPSCGEALHHQRADDAPPYVTMVIVGHIVIGGVLALEQAYSPAQWIHFVLWMPLTIGLSLYLLPRVKGALIALQWALRMHGFGESVGVDDKAGGPSAIEPPLAVQTADR